MNNFYKDHFLINLNEYPNIDIDFQISLFLLWITIGVLLATILVSYSRASMSLMIKRLIRHNAYDENSAMTLNELKINSLGVKILLMNSSPLTKIVKRVGEKTYTYEEYKELTKNKNFKEEKIDFAAARFYVRDESMNRAKHIAESNSPTILSTALVSLLIVSIYICLLLLMPEILTLLNNILG